MNSMVKLASLMDLSPPQVPVSHLIGESHLAE